MAEDDELLTRRQAAERAGVTSGTIRLWERAGRLHSIPTGDPRLGPLYSATEIAEAMRRTALLRAASGIEAAAHSAVDVDPSDDVEREVQEQDLAAVAVAESAAPPDTGEATAAPA